MRHDPDPTPPEGIPRPGLVPVFIEAIVDRGHDDDPTETVTLGVIPEGYEGSTDDLPGDFGCWHWLTEIEAADLAPGTMLGEWRVVEVDANEVCAWGHYFCASIAGGRCSGEIIDAMLSPTASALLDLLRAGRRCDFCGVRDAVALRSGGKYRLCRQHADLYDDETKRQAEWERTHPEEVGNPFRGALER